MLRECLCYGKNITQVALAAFNYHGAYGVMVSTGVCGAPSPGSNPGRHPHFSSYYLKSYIGMYYLYILKSKKDDKLYIGSTNDLRRRLSEEIVGASADYFAVCYWTVLGGHQPDFLVLKGG